MNTGKVKFFNETKGFGFVLSDEDQKEYFVHATGLIDKIQDNDDVVFDIEEGKKGMQAVRVKLSK
jgi:cold shock protein